MGSEDAAIEALTCAAKGKPFDGSYRGGMKQYPREYDGSWNIRVMWRCAEYAANRNPASRQWILSYLKSQLTERHDFMGKELLSRLYGPWNLAAITVAHKAAVEANDDQVKRWTKKWIDAWYFLHSLVALPVVNQRAHRKAKPQVTVPTAGMRTPQHSQDHSPVDSIFDWGVNGRDVGDDVPHTYWPYDLIKMTQRPAEYWELKDVYVHGELAKQLERFLPQGITARADVYFERYEKGSACWLSRNVNGNTAPTLAAVGYDADDGTGHVKWLHPHPASRPTASGDNGAVKTAGRIESWFQDHIETASLPHGQLLWSCVLSPAGFEALQLSRPQPSPPRNVERGWFSKLRDAFK